MRYKIISNIEILNQINQAAKIAENNPDVIYCEEKKHPIRNEYAILILETSLRSCNLPFIDELLSGTIENLPSDWEWPFPLRLIRVIIPLWVQAKAQTYTDSEEKWYYLKDLIEAMLSIVEEFTITDLENVTIYLEELYDQHRAILEMFESEGIKIEEL